MQDLHNDLRRAIEEGRREAAVTLTQTLLAQDSPLDILKTVIAGMDEVARRYSAHEIFVPDVLVAARAMECAAQCVAPKMAEAGFAPQSTVVIGSVEGDMHDIGKNLLAMLLRGANFNVVDLGVNVPAAQFSEAVRAHCPRFVGLSALLTTTLGAMKTTVDHLRAAALPPQVKIMVGGAPVTQAFADEIGADLYAPDAVAAVTLVKSMVG